MLKRTVLSVVLMTVFTANAEPSGESQFFVTTHSSLLWGVLLVLAVIGFALIEAGAAKTKNVTVICVKKVGMYAIACIAFYLIGFNLMFIGVDGGFFGSPQFLHGATPEEIAVLNGSAPVELIFSSNENRASMSAWWVYMMFAALAVAIFSGSVSERSQIWAVFVFTVVFAALIFPIVGAWTWGRGWLHTEGFTDFAGATVVHSTAGWCALTGAIILGSRQGKFQASGIVNPTPPSNVPLVVLGVFLVWVGWFAYVCAAKMSESEVADAISLSSILINTNLSACAGFLTAVFLSKPLFGRLNLLGCLNGALAGLVAISAGPEFSDHHLALLVGVVAGALSLAFMRLLERFAIDDELGTVSAHLVAGVWGTLAVCFTNADTSFFVQIVGIGAVGIFVASSSALLWFGLKAALQARVSSRVEIIGQDLDMSGIEAYPEFILMPEDMEMEEITP